MKRITTTQLREIPKKGSKIVMVTCYDATFARLVDESNVDAILIGDSLGAVIQGHDYTLPVTVDDVIYHARAVARGCSRPHLVGDMPFGSYQISKEIALQNAIRLLKEGGVQAVKLEGGEPVAETVARMVEVGIPVMGHLGLTPQSVHQMGGYKIQGRTQSAGERLLRDAKALQDAGCYSLVLEGIPAQLAAQVTEMLEIPTIGIGAGPSCDGQVLVLQDMLGLNMGFTPKFLKKYAELGETTISALNHYAEEVRGGLFPDAEHSH